jgi:tetratricopeptide (TPR) repeat protein
LSNIGSTYIDIGEYSLAEPYIIESIKNINNKHGNDNINYVVSLNNLGNVYLGLKKYDEAIKAFSEAIKVYKNNFGENHSLYATFLQNIGNSYYKLKNYLKAQKFHLESFEIRKIIYSEDNFDLYKSLHSIGVDNIHLNNIKSGFSYFDKSFEVLNNIKKQFFEYSNNREKEIFQNNISSEYEIYQSYFYSNSILPKKYIISTQTLYNNELQNKGIVLRTNIFLDNVIAKTNDSNLKITIDTLQKVKNKLSIIYRQTIDNRPSNYKQIQGTADSLEKILIAQSQPYRTLRKKDNLTWVDIQAVLKPNEAAIEFISFQYFKNDWTDSILYGALILRPGYIEPKFVYLFEQKQLELLVKKQTHIHDSLYINKLYQYSQNGKKLQELIWNPIESHLIGVNTVYVAASGILNTINLNALPFNKYFRVGDRYKLRIVGTTGDIISKSDQFLNDCSISKAWLFGGIDYDNIIYSKESFTSDIDLKYILSINQNTRAGTEKWSYLPNTLYEASFIDSVCRKNNINTSFINGKLASKTIFKNISGENRPYILHLATHAYFFSKIQKQRKDLMFKDFYSKQNIFKMSDNPLFRSGLIFSGANKSWAKSNIPSDSSDDGILTSYEISNLDFSEAKLVVMSACETGLGDINRTEGVFGLQRAFKLAGANNIIMSLWKVPDAQTKELMKMFYQNCFKGLSISDALRTAQTEMSKKYSPYYWAAFKLLE